ncbi:MAG: hypothetical protein U0353_16495 [Sandaracinus sp.]
MTWGSWLLGCDDATHVAGSWAISKELVEMRELPVTDLTSLVNGKRVDATVLAGLRGSVGFRNQVTDVVQLTAIFRRHWESVRATTPVTIDDLERAETLATKLTQLLGMREQGSLEASGVGEMRQRAFSKFVHTYDQLRRAMTFLRWDEGDVDSVIPSLWAGRGGRGKRTEVEVAKDETKSGETKSGETKSGETKSGETKKAEPKSGEPKSDEPPMDDLRGLPPPFIEGV